MTVLIYKKFNVDTFFASVVFLGHMDTSSYLDATGRHTLASNVGGTQVPGLFGNAASFSGGSVGLSYTNGTQDFNFGVGDFTIELTISLATLAASQQLVCCHNAFYSVSWTLESSGGALGFYNYDAMGSVISDPTSISINTPTRYAVVRFGTQWYIYRNGVKATTSSYGSAFSVGSTSSSHNLGIGGPSNQNTYGMNGWIDEVRITKGVARYTGASYVLDNTPFLNV